MKNKKVGMISITVILALMLTVVIGLDQEKKVLAAETRTIIDNRGKVVVIPKDINRVITGTPVPLGAAYYAVVGSAEKLVGIHPFSMSAAKASMLAVMAPEIKKASTGFIEGSVVNIEELLKLEPDVFFGSISGCEGVEMAGIPMIGVYSNINDPHCIERAVELIGEVMGEEQRASEIITYHRKTLEMIRSRTARIPKEKRTKVLVLTGVEELKLGNYCWPEVAGGIDVAENLGGWKTANMEQILVWNPDVIYIGNFCENYPEDILENKIEGQDWSPIEAVKNGRVYKVPLGEYRWDPWCVEWSLMFKWCAQKQYPELFNDYSIEEEIKEFYSMIFHYDISDEQIEMILHPKPTGIW